MFLGFTLHHLHNNSLHFQMTHTIKVGGGVLLGWGCTAYFVSCPSSSSHVLALQHSTPITPSSCCFTWSASFWRNDLALCVCLSSCSRSCPCVTARMGIVCSTTPVVREMWRRWHPELLLASTTYLFLFQKFLCQLFPIHWTVLWFGSARRV